MQINSINSLIHNMTTLSSQKDTLSVNNKTDVIPDTKSGNSWDIHHMTVGELRDMITELYNNGTLSPEETMDLSGQQFTLALFGDYPFKLNDNDEE